jgi:hypothetical protein
VDESLMTRARQALAPANDSSVLEEALRALLAQRLEAEIDGRAVARSCDSASTPSFGRAEHHNNPRPRLRGRAGAGDDPVGRVSVVNLDLLGRVCLSFLVQRIGRLSEVRMEQVCDALAVAVACRR